MFQSPEGALGVTVIVVAVGAVSIVIDVGRVPVPGLVFTSHLI